MAGDGYAEVSPAEARQVPYPVIYVEEDGSFRECTPAERAYLQESFHPADGGRPYVKDNYRRLTPDGRISGFLWRSQLPPKARASR